MILAAMPQTAITQETLSLQQRTELLDGTIYAKFFSWQELQILVQHMTFVSVVPETVIFREGDRGDFLAILTEGRVLIRKTCTRDGHDRLVATIRPPRSFGEMALLDAEPRSATAMAESACRLFILRQGDFAKLEQSYPRVWGRLLFQIAKLMSQRLRVTSSELVDMLDEP
ncbi:MAG: cyclic nucleotide-binding domain-containing protein [Pseudomonadota bacterium]